MVCVISNLTVLRKASWIRRFLLTSGKLWELGANMLGRAAFVRSFTGFSSHLTKRWAGHSKWANIKHVKAEKDGARALLFSRLGQKMRVAIQEGGSNDPGKNIILAQTIEIAKKKNMPVAAIQNYLKVAAGDKDKHKVQWLEIKGPRGVYIIAQTLTSAPRQTRDTIASILRRNGTVFADNSGKNMFDHKGVIIANPPKGTEDALEKAVDDAIECGAEEVVSTEEGTPDEREGKLKFLCDMQDLNIIKTKLETKSYEIISADYDLIPKMKIELNDAEMEAVSKLMDKLEEHPDIVKMYDNIA